MNWRWMRIVVPVVAGLCLCCLAASAQPKGSKSDSSDSGGDSGSSSGGGSSAPGFSIETEMFTYQAVQANAKVIACDIAQYLYSGKVESAPAGSHAPCAVQNTSGTAPGIILISSGSTLLQDFQIWRSDMAIMSGLEQRADQVCVARAPAQGANEQNQQGSGIESRGLLSTIISNASPATAAATSAAGFLSMLGKSEAVTPVIGTVQDPALLNEVGRQLRAVGIRVLIPEMYSPNALGSADDRHSPYMSNLQQLFVAHDKCDKAMASYGKDKDQTGDIASVMKSIDSFLSSAFVATPAKVSDGSGAESNGANTAVSPQPPRMVSHFTAALSADDMAREMGFTGSGPGGASPTWQHLMWLRALESGGSVEKSGGLFGTKVYFGGGAVDTYSVFRLDGQLVCSGNVYDFQAPVKMDNLQKMFEKGLTFDAAKSPLLESSCDTLPPEQH